MARCDDWFCQRQSCEGCRWLKGRKAPPADVTEDAAEKPAARQKHLFRIDTHLRSEWKWAYTSAQAAWLVYQEYRRYSCNMTFLECRRAWKAFRKGEVTNDSADTGV